VEGEPSRVRALGSADVEEVVSVLCEAFFDYPVMRFVVGTGEYRSRLDALITFFVMARIQRDEVVLGVPSDTGLCGVALISDPEEGASPPELGALREETWARVGAEARSRYESFSAVASRFTPTARHLHLNMIGVRRVAQGQGVGRLLLDAVHERSAQDESSQGVGLTTEVESNVALYRRFGYRVIGSAAVGSAFTTWSMYRPDR